MKVLVTGATGFVGRWLVQELTSAGHTVIAAPPRAELDLAKTPDFRPGIEDARPDAVVHLAAVTYLPDAEADPDRARRINVGGTSALFDALDAIGSSAPVLLTSTADVYSRSATLPIAEDAPIEPESVYGRTKLDQEHVAREAGAGGRRVIIARAFNHIGPGQRPVFVVPALARRVLELKLGRTDSIRVGNLSPRRDFTDVRDVVHAYRLLLETPATGAEGESEGAMVVNVGSGRSVAIEDILRALCRLAGVDARWHVDPELVRPVDVADRYADVSLLRSLTGWEPRIPLEASLTDVLAAAES